MEMEEFSFGSGFLFCQMTVDSVSEAVKEVSVAMGIGCEGVLPETVGKAWKPSSDCKPDDPGRISGFLQSDGVPDDPQGLCMGFCGGGKERSGCKIVHSQVLRIRKEDHRLVEDDVREGLDAREKIAVVRVSTRMDVLFYARPILPSPLGTKAPMN